MFGLVPWTVAFAWTPLILGAYAVAANLFDSRISRVIATTLILTVFDVVLDPGAVLLGFWQYDGGGWFYGVPMSNFVGWLVSGLIGSVILEGLMPIQAAVANADAACNKRYADRVFLGYDRDIWRLEIPG